MKKVAILRSSHIEVGRVDADKLEWVYAKTEGDDFLQVIGEDGQSYWCDEIEFITEG